MSVDYLICNHCGDTFPDCGYYVTCEGCGSHWCSDECAKEDGYIEEHCKKYSILDNRDLMENYREDHCDYNDCYDCENYVGESCGYCRNEIFEDYELLNYTLKKLGITREDLIKEYKEKGE